MIIKFFPEFSCYSLWVVTEFGVDNIDPNELPLSDNLKTDIKKWEDEYESIYNPNNPAESGFESSKAEAEFWNTGEKLFKRLKTELPDDDILYSRPMDKIFL
ncbi:hypothetical protein [Exercitatus varius]|uniref:hypothetical protein n=1 Tax=Exercitatus varius TaxID=67857 RepID=UPI00294B5A4D|nr:hypothetical protein [Exercitatus varius]MDG2944694.1 hypothetical protein [Exercitatus varius]MDG2959189.1 hypothetical protein [Exercitatus varius]